MDNPIIICIVGQSGSGKSLMADYLAAKHGIPMIQSRTTREPRYKGEPGHLYVSNEEFDTYKKEDMLAFTVFGENRYCCLKQDVTAPMMSYVIDETGITYLYNMFACSYHIRSIRIHRSTRERIKAVGQERVDRDRGMFNLPDEWYDFVIDNNNGKDDMFRQVNMIVKLIKTKML